MIQEGIPKELLMNLTKTEKQSPTIKKVFELALTKPDDEVSPRQKRNIQAMLDSGRLDKDVEVLDHEVEKLIDEYYKVEIDKAVRLGRLPKEAPKLESLKNKGIQYAKRQEKRLRTIFTGKDSDVEGDTQENQNNQESDTPQQNNGASLPQPSAATFRR